jgi:hypothetical protein
VILFIVSSRLARYSRKKTDRRVFERKLATFRFQSS